MWQKICLQRQMLWIGEYCKNDESMTIQELIETINKEKQKRDFMHELTPANAALFREIAGGTF